MPNIVRFDGFDVDCDARQLHKRGLRVKLRDQSIDVLLSLLDHPGRVVTREDLRRRLWGDDVFVDFDNNLNLIIARLRQALAIRPSIPASSKLYPSTDTASSLTFKWSPLGQQKPQCGEPNWWCSRSST
jgi:hypothetical protein